MSSVDDLVRELDIGQRVRVIGRPVVDHQQRSVAFEVRLLHSATARLELMVKIFLW